MFFANFFLKEAPCCQTSKLPSPAPGSILSADTSMPLSQGEHLGGYLWKSAAALDLLEGQGFPVAVTNLFLGDKAFDHLTGMSTQDLEGDFSPYSSEGHLILHTGVSYCYLSPLSMGHHQWKVLVKLSGHHFRASELGSWEGGGEVDWVAVLYKSAQKYPITALQGRYCITIPIS